MKKDHCQLNQLEEKTIINGENSCSSSDEETNLSTTISKKINSVKSQESNINISSNANMNCIALKVDDKSNNFIYKCQMCSSFFQNTGELQMHYLIKHKNVMTPCPESFHKKKKSENTHIPLKKSLFNPIEEHKLDAT